jgi:hypothetical protein
MKGRRHTHRSRSSESSERRGIQVPTLGPGETMIGLTREEFAPKGNSPAVGHDTVMPNYL